MAADFLQKNRYSSRFLTEGFLKRIRQKMATMNEGKLRKQDKENHQGPKDSCNHHPQAEEEKGQHHQQVKDDSKQPEVKDDSKQPDDVSSGTKDPSSPSNDIHDNDDSATTTRTTNFNDVAAAVGDDVVSSCLKPKTSLSNELVIVRIPRPPCNPRLAHSTPSSRTDEMGGSSSLILIPEICSVARAADHLMTMEHINPKDVENIFDAAEEATHQQHSHAVDGHLVKRESNYSTTLRGLITYDNVQPFINDISEDDARTGVPRYCHQEDSAPGICFEGEDQPDGESEDASVGCHTGTVTEDEAITSSGVINKQSTDNAEEDIPRVQTESDETKEKDTHDNKGSESNIFSEQTSQRLSCEEAFEQYSKDANASCPGGVHNESCCCVSNQPETYPRLKMEISHVKATAGKSYVSSNKILGKRNQFLSLINLLFHMKLARRNDDEDLEPLVDEDVPHEIPRRDETKKKKKKNNKKTWSRRRSLLKKTESEATRPSNPTSSCKAKRRRPRKKNVYRVGRRLRKNLNKGCLNVRYGFSYLVTEVPPRRRTNGYNTNIWREDALSNHFNLDAAASNSGKKRFITLDSFKTERDPQEIWG